MSLFNFLVGENPTYNRKVAAFLAANMAENAQKGNDCLAIGDLDFQTVRLEGFSWSFNSAYADLITQENIGRIIATNSCTRGFGSHTQIVWVEYCEEGLFARSNYFIKRGQGEYQRDQFGIDCKIGEVLSVVLEREKAKGSNWGNGCVPAFWAKNPIAAFDNVPSHIGACSNGNFDKIWMRHINNTPCVGINNHLYFVEDLKPLNKDKNILWLKDGIYFKDAGYEETASEVLSTEGLEGIPYSDWCFEYGDVTLTHDKVQVGYIFNTEITKEKGLRKGMWYCKRGEYDTNRLIF